MVLRKVNITLQIFLTINLFTLIAGCDEDEVTTIDPPSGYNFIDVEPSWSPDGTKIVYIHQETYANPGSGLYVIDTNGQNKRMILEGFQKNPDWSPNGEWIVYCNQAQIYKIKLNGDSLTQLTFEGNNFFPSWSNDGEWIAFDSNLESANGMNFIWKMKNDGTQKKRIIYEPNVGEIRMPSWNSESSKLAVQKYITGISGELIALIDTSGNTVIVLTNNNFDRYPRFSSNNSKVLFTRITSSYYQIFSINTDGTNLQQLTNILLFYTEQGYTADWSPDGEKIVYCNSSPNNGHLWVMDKNGSNKKQLTF